VILDGKVIPCDRCKEPARSVKGEAIDLWYSGKAHTHGGNTWAGYPGRSRLRGCRHRHPNPGPPARGPQARYRQPHAQRSAASLRCLGERGFALLTGRWRALQHITLSPSKIGDIARAALVLTHFEHGYIA
jgi:hypothetical protein